MSEPQDWLTTKVNLYASIDARNRLIDELEAELEALRVVRDAAQEVTAALAERDWKPGWTQQHLYHCVDDLADALAALPQKEDG